jgi:hypothetical protein
LNLINHQRTKPISVLKLDIITLIIRSISRGIIVLIITNKREPRKHRKHLQREEVRKQV